VEASPTPTLQEFQPYKEALVRHLYEVIETREGPSLNGQQISVSQWSWLGAQPLPSQSLKAGDTVVLTLHREKDHPELQSLYAKDTLINALTADTYHDAGGWDKAVEKP
jgi:hypothetical protein